MAGLFRRPERLPSSEEFGRLYNRESLINGNLCRWCGGRQVLSHDPRGWLRCPFCDLPDLKDNTMLKVE